MVMMMKIDSLASNDPSGNGDGSPPAISHSGILPGGQILVFFGVSMSRPSNPSSQGEYI
jgi:hypothetical protein